MTIAFDEARQRLRTAVLKAQLGASTLDPDLEDLSTSSSELEVPRTATFEEWPALDPAALYGVFGDIVKTIRPHTEADDAAILTQSLVAFGSILNRAPHFRAEADHHAMNLYMTLVGETAKGRKGTSWGQVRRLFQSLDPDWAGARVMTGLSSGEGLIWQVRDEITKPEPIKESGRYTGEVQTVRVDPGITDKRLLVLESEFANVLAVMRRDGNTLSAILRQAWDTGDLRSMVKNSPARSTGAHVSIIAHITKDELLRLMETTEAANGFANRFLWVCSRRSKFLPDGGSLRDGELVSVSDRLSRAVQFGRTTGQIHRDDDARTLWHKVYPALSIGAPGLLGAVTSRAEAITMRLACLYALGDMSYVVTPSHLTAALALWEYCEASARYIFGQRLGDPVADELLKALRQSPPGMTRTEIRDWFGRNRKSHEIDRGLALLAKQNLAHKTMEQTGTRPVERWFASTEGTTYTTNTTNPPLGSGDMS